MEGPKQERFKVTNEEMTQILKSIGGIIADKIPEDYSFTLIISRYHDAEDTSYISSCTNLELLKVIYGFILQQIRGTSKENARVQ